MIERAAAVGLRLIAFVRAPPEARDLRSIAEELVRLRRRPRVRPAPQPARKLP